MESLKIIFWILLLYGIAGFIVKKMNVTTGRIERKVVQLPLWLYSFISGIAGILILSVIIRIGPQSVGVLETPNGVSNDELHTGWHIIMPWNKVHIMDKTVWVYTCANSNDDGTKRNADAIWAPTKDGIKMGFDVSVSWKINPNEASWIYQNVTENDGGVNGRYFWLEDNVIRAKLKSAMALVVSLFTPIEVYSTKRENIQKLVFQRIEKELAVYKIILDQIDLREVYYNPEYEKAINNKKLAEQEALRLVEVTKQKEEQLKQAEIEKNIAIQKAEGEAKALQIKGSSINANPKIIQLEWINKWDGKLPLYQLGSSQGIIMNLPSEK